MNKKKLQTRYQSMPRRIKEIFLGLYINKYNLYIIKNVKPYAPGEKICKLCLQEKLSILISKPSLNKRSEIFGHCVHRKQFLLNNIKEQYTPPASQQQQRKYSTNQQLSRLKKEPYQASKLLSNDNDDI